MHPIKMSPGWLTANVAPLTRVEHLGDKVGRPRIGVPENLIGTHWKTRLTVRGRNAIQPAIVYARHVRHRVGGEAHLSYGAVVSGFPGYPHAFALPTPAGRPMRFDRRVLSRLMGVGRIEVAVTG